MRITHDGTHSPLASQRWMMRIACDMTPPYVTWLISLWRDSFMCDMTYSHVTWLLDMWQDSFTCDVTPVFVYTFRKRREMMRITRGMWWRITFDMEEWRWRRLIKCLKSQVVFRKRATNHRACLREMTYKDKTSYDSTPPCNMTHSHLMWLVCMWSDSFMCNVTSPRVTWLIPIWHDSFTCDMTHSQTANDAYDTWHDSFIRDMAL